VSEATSTDAGAVAPSVPLLRVVKGDPTPEELAALIAVVATRSGGSPEVAPEPTSAWRDRSRYVRRPMTPGPNAWRASVLPS
jgi:Acyl-CoA carboxylase epsilon subunit